MINKNNGNVVKVRQTGYDVPDMVTPAVAGIIARMLSHDLIIHRGGFHRGKGSRNGTRSVLLVGDYSTDRQIYEDFNALYAGLKEIGAQFPVKLEVVGNGSGLEDISDIFKIHAAFTEKDIESIRGLP